MSHSENGEARAQVQAVAAIIREGDRYLVGKRSPWKAKAPGYWCAITGRIESGESEAEAAVREAFEETSLIVRATRKIHEMDIDQGETRLHWWLVDVLSGTPTLANDEHTELRWVTIDEMAALEPVFDEDVEVFRGFAGSAGLAPQTS